MSARLRLVASDHGTEPRRFRPYAGRLLTMANIRGPWRPSGSVGGSGIFAVVWESHGGLFWAAMHDFAPADQLRLIEACRRIDIEASGAWR